MAARGASPCPPCPTACQSTSPCPLPRLPRPSFGPSCCPPPARCATCALPLPTAPMPSTPASLAIHCGCATTASRTSRSEEHTSELQSRGHLVCRLLLEKKKRNRA